MELLSENSEPEWAHRVNSVSFWTKLDRDALKVSHHPKAAEGAADPNAWASTLDKMTNDDKHAGGSEG